MQGQGLQEDLERRELRVDCGKAMGGIGQQKVDGTFSNDAFDLKMQIQIEPQGKPNTIHMVGKRIGACKEK